MLTDEEILDAISPLYVSRSVAHLGLDVSIDEYRAIESAATAPLLAEIERLKTELSYAMDAAAKGDKARAEAGGMEMRISELEAQANPEKQIAEALRKVGLTLVKKQGGYSVMELGQITAQASNAQPSQEEPRHLWDGSPVPNYRVTREENTEAKGPRSGPA